MDDWGNQFCDEILDTTRLTPEQVAEKVISLVEVST
jgi:hypothetical protein